MRLGFHCAEFFVHLASLCEAVLMTSRHFSFRCVPIQHGILNVHFFSSTPFWLLLMMSIQSSSSSSAWLELSSRCCLGRGRCSCLFHLLTPWITHCCFLHRLSCLLLHCLFCSCSCISFSSGRRVRASCVKPIESSSRVEALESM